MRCAGAFLVKRMFKTLLTFLFLSLAFGMSAKAKGLDPVFVSQVKASADASPSEAVALAGNKLKELLAHKPQDVQSIFSLLDFQRGLATQASNSELAANILVDMAKLAQANREELSTDPLPLLQDAAALYESIGDLRTAQRVLETALNLATENRIAKSQRIKLVQALLVNSKKRNNSAGQNRYEDALANLLIEQSVAINPGDKNSTTRGSEDGYKSVKVYYATDRARENSTIPSKIYGHKRGNLELGTAIVTIPESHKSGEVEAPSIWRLEFSESSNKHVILKSVTPHESSAYFSQMQSDLKGKINKEAFVFIHGFNVSFEKAVKRAAQLAHDMQFDGLPIAYSWPSRHSVLEYVADTAVVRLSGRRLAGFIEDVVRRSGAKTIHLVAHSMGNRAMTDALELIAARRSLANLKQPPLDQVIFAAPDVDAGLFVEMVKTIRPLARRLTLYASRNDWALKVSQKVHGDSKRAGQGGEGTLVSGTLDSIDMSNLGGDMLAHGYFAKETSALLDLASLFWQNSNPSDRCGLERKSAAASEQGAGYFWVYKPGTCDTDVFLPLLAHIRARSLTTRKELESLFGELKIDQIKYPNVSAAMGRMMPN